MSKTCLRFCISNYKTMSQKLLRKCFLKSLNKELPTIELTDTKQIIGRNPETNISNVICSRKQICAKANLDDGYVLIKRLGTNPSAINGFVIEIDQVYEAQQGDVVEIILDKFMYEVMFDPPVENEQPQLPDVVHEKKKTPRKRTSFDSENEPSTSKKSKASESSSEKLSLKVDPATEDKWEKIDAGKLYIFTKKGLKSSDKIAAYDMDGTLIKTKSGNVFPKTIDDWQIGFAEVPKKIQTLFAEGYKIVLFTNQAGIGKGKVRIEDFKIKMEGIVGKLGVPVQAFIATGPGTFRKPMTGMWELLEKDKNDGIKINLEKSVYVGDAAGRPENKALKRKKDHSSADRLFALNLKLKFQTPEEHFMNAKPQEWIRPDFDPTTYKIPDSITEPKNIKLSTDSLDIVIMVGIPGSGKSFFVKNYLEKAGYRIVNRDKLGSWQKCVSAMDQMLSLKKNVVIDNTNPDKESRKRYIDAAKKFKCPIRCFIMNTTVKHAKHNNIYRELTDPSHVKINEIVFNSYKSKFEEPSKDEGFTEIVKINFIPKFEDIVLQNLYKIYLLDK